MKAAWILLACFVIAGCNSAPPVQAPTPEKEGPMVEENPVEVKNALYEQLHSGLFQADAAVKKIGDAVDIARDVQTKVPPELAAALKDMVGTLDDSGAALADVTGGEPPTEEQVKKDETAFKSRRDRLINLISDTLKGVREQMGVAADLAENGPEAIRKSCAKVDVLLNQVIDDLLGSLEALGAKEDISLNPPDTGDTNSPPPRGFGGTSTG